VRNPDLPCDGSLSDIASVPDHDHVRWIGGSPCAGKSTITRHLAKAGHLARYHCDDHFERHSGELAGTSAAFARILNRTDEDRLSLPIAEQVEDEFLAYREEFPLILRDISDFSGPVIAEAAALLPELLASISIPRDRAVWIVPTEEFQRWHYRQREWAWNMLAATTDPARLFDRWMQRDAAYARLVADQARALDYHIIVVDGSRPIESIQAEAASILGL
jgi:hypothetical protein